MNILYKEVKNRPKAKTFILTIFLCIILFLNCWFSDYLFANFFLISPIFDVFLLCAYFYFLIKNYEELRTQNWEFSLIGIVLLLFIGAFVLFAPTRKIKTKVEFNWLLPKRMEVIELIKKNELALDELGNGKLPKYLKGVSNDKEITVYQNDEEGIVISFWIFRGMLSGSRELIYSSKGEELVWKNETGHKIVSIEPIRDNWYYVITEY